MSFNHVTFLSDWVSLDRQSVAMVGKKATLEVENNRGDLSFLNMPIRDGKKEKTFSVPFLCSIRSWANFGRSIPRP